MSLRKLQFSEPLFSILFIENETLHKIENASIVINLAPRGIRIKDKPLGSLKSTIVRNVAARDIERALVIEDYERNRNQAELLAAIRKRWALMYDLTGQDRFKGIPVRRSPKEKIDTIELYLFCVDAMTNVGLHQQHSHREVHTQLLGYGKMQKFEENDYNTLYQEEILAPGYTHEPFYTGDNVYPWHQYQSISDSIYLYVIIETSM